MDPVLPPPSTSPISPDPSPGSDAATVGENSSFALGGTLDKSVAKPSYNVSRVIFFLVIFLLLAGGVAGAIFWLHEGRIQQEYEQLYSAEYTASPTSTPQSTLAPSVEPTLTPGNSNIEIQQDFDQTNLPSFDSEANDLQSDTAKQ